MKISYRLLFNCFIIGIFTIIIGIITEHILCKFDKKDNCLSRIKIYYSNFIILLFIFGFTVHLFFECSGFESYCEKKCINNNCSYICHFTPFLQRRF